MNAYQLYRGTTLGMALQDTLDEFMQSGCIKREVAYKIQLEFDKVINKALSQRTNKRLEFKAGKLNFYRHVDNVWTLVLSDIELRYTDNKKDGLESIWVDRMKIIACDGNPKELKF